MRIGVLIDPVSAEAGGSHTFQNQIVEALRSHGGGRGHTFFVMGHWDNASARDDSAKHTEYIDIFSNRVLNLRAKWEKIKFILRQQRKPPPAFKRTFLAEFFARAAKVNMVWYLTPSYGAMDLPFIHTVWDLQHRLQPWFPEVSDTGQWAHREEHYSNVLPRASAVLTGTEAGKAEISSLYRVPAEHIHVVAFPVREPVVASEQEIAGVLAKHGLSPGYLYYPAQFWPHKNHAGAIEAASVLRETYGISIPLVFVGSDTSTRRYIEEAVRVFGLSDQVKILGFVSREDCDALYKRALALFMPTFFGPDNIPPLEAFASGCPVLASNVPGSEEQLGDAALLFDPNDPNAMALAIKRLYEDPSLRSNLIRKGHLRAAKWSGQQYVEKVLAIIESFRPALRCWMSDLLLEDRRAAAGADRPGHSKS